MQTAKMLALSWKCTKSAFLPESWWDLLLSLFWKHQPRSCISPVSSWSALTPGAGRSVRSSSAGRREGVCWWCQIPWPFSALCYAEAPFPSRLSCSVLQHVLGTVLSLWVALQVPVASRKDLWGMKQCQVPAAQYSKYILRVINQQKYRKRNTGL